MHLTRLRRGGLAGLDAGRERRGRYGAAPFVSPVNSLLCACLLPVNPASGACRCSASSDSRLPIILVREQRFVHLGVGLVLDAFHTQYCE